MVNNPQIVAYGFFQKWSVTINPSFTVKNTLFHKWKVQHNNKQAYLFYVTSRMKAYCNKKGISCHNSDNTTLLYLRQYFLSYHWQYFFVMHIFQHNFSKAVDFWKFWISMPLFGTYNFERHSRKFLTNISPKCGLQVVFTISWWNFIL